MYKIYIGKNKSSKEMIDKYLINKDIIYNEFGKPYIKNNPIYFNISHANEWTVLAISDKEIGIDIQKITYNEKLLNRFGTKEEINIVKNEYDWTKLWVKKESYVKCLGIGLSYGLENVDTLNTKGFRIKKYKNYYICVYKKDS